MTPRYKGEWHPVTVELIEGCRDEDGKRCTRHCPEPCEDETEITIEHPPSCRREEETPDWGYRCGVDEAIYEHPADELEPGRYRIRHWHEGPDYWGEHDDGIDIEDAS